VAGVIIGLTFWITGGHLTAALIIGMVGFALYAPFMRYVGGPRLRTRRDHLFPPPGRDTPQG
jgi:hypothetical protein